MVAFGTVLKSTYKLACLSSATVVAYFSSDDLVASSNELANACSLAFNLKRWKKCVIATENKRLNEIEYGYFTWILEPMLRPIRVQCQLYARRPSTLHALCSF